MGGEGLGKRRTSPLMAAAPTLFTMTMNSSTANMTRRSEGDMFLGYKVPGSRIVELERGEGCEETRCSMMSSVWWLLSRMAFGRSRVSELST